jgi:hypothetical protein
MNAGTLWFLIKLLPLLAATAILFGYFGWWLRRKFHAPVVNSHKPAAAPDDLPARERVKKLEHALAKSEAAQKALKHDLETLQAKSVSKAALDKTAKELADAQHRLETDLKRIQALETELKKSRDTINTLNSNAAEANKGQRERTFALENELSKTREALAIHESRPDNTLVLQAEVDRLREALTNSTRVIGELRKQEAAAVEAMTKAQKKLEAALAKAAPEETGAVSLIPAMDRATRKQPKPGPAVEPIDIVANTKAEVARINALNAQKEAERIAAEQAAANAKAEQDRLAADQAAANAKAEQDRLAAEQAAANAKAEQDRLAADQAAAEAKAEQDRLAAEQAAAEQAAAEAKAEQERLAAEQVAAAAKAEQERLAAEQAAAEQAAAEAKAEQDRLAAEARAEQELLAAQAAAAAAMEEQDRLAAQQAAKDLLAAIPNPDTPPVQPDLFAAEDSPPAEVTDAKRPAE